ncbi:MAG TPA: ATP-binding protein, partial [Polyangiaceae bacterium]|nr:ATP-binding protein [Polyangiaceae bacterium]
MQIKHVEIGNFRKLQAARIDFADATTIFVGANNSGKTSAMVALRRFLIDRTAFTINDFTLSHWGTLDALGRTWEADNADTAPTAFDWNQVLPFLDVWLDVPMDQIHYVQPLLPTLDWDGSTIGVRLRYEPKDLERLKYDYLAARKAVDTVMCLRAPPGGGVATQDPAQASNPEFSLWPRTLVEFLTRDLHRLFEVRAYLLDPARLEPPSNGLAKPQALAADNEPIDEDPFKGLIRIDEISAQRGLGFSASTRDDDTATDGGEQRLRRRLSTQLRAYYTHHLDPIDKPEPKDLAALEALFDAQLQFGKRMESSFAHALNELEDIGYPGITDPKLTIAAKLSLVDGLNHPSAVQFQVPTHVEPGSFNHHLPEDSNGLGYQNLISIVFAMMSFRDKWMKVGKAGITLAADDVIPPLHLVLIEEPEAHLHAQVQQVFVRQAYEVLRRHPRLEDADALRTQLVISTHSSHIAHEADFASLRYFRRLPAPPTVGAVPVSSVVNLSEIFGPG